MNASVPRTDYLVPGTNFVISKGRYVKVFVKNMTMSERNFKNPKEFDPQNYAPENNPSKFATMIFGQGPRNCIGMRYALLTLKIGIVYMLRSYRILRSPKTPQVLINPFKSLKDPNAFKNPVFVKFERR